jgi:pyruvate/2-oxoglutarate dehydrogenase complex dihydrolipoamide dehydrogenase (E3) component
MRRFGSRVTITHRAGRPLERADADVPEALLQLMRDEGIEVLLGATVVSFLPAISTNDLG